MKGLEDLVNKNGLRILGSLIKLNRLNQNMSQMALCEGICVSSYLSKIENGEVIPSLEVIELLFNQLAIDYRCDYEFLVNMNQRFEQFFEELNFNGLIHTAKIFNELEENELELIHSPLIVDYYLIKLAHYCATENRDAYSSAHQSLISVKSLLNTIQRYKLYLYQGIDLLYYHHQYDDALQYFKLARQELETGRLYEMLAIVNYRRGDFFDAYQNVTEALRRYLQEGNLVSLAGLYEFEALLAYKTGSQVQAIELYQRACTYGIKMNRLDLTLTPLLSQAIIYMIHQEFIKVRQMLDELNLIQEKLQANWPILILVECLEMQMKGVEALEQWEELYSRCHSQMKSGLALIIFCLTQGEVAIHELPVLIAKHKKCSQRFLIVDEWIFHLLKHYFLTKRQYKEVVTLLEAQNI